ncbi:MAG: hypothetical protein LBD92_08560 [Oscillospiraceae bacterium]|jgi:hypothetical protein|nr:hypothetical protein [Oscillospiraceae bacterium]
MSVGRIKNLVIAALIMINLFLLLFFVWGRAGEISARREVIEDICVIMGNNGIVLEPSSIGGAGGLASRGTSRDAAAEDAAAAAVLGNCEKTESGSISRYLGARGSASFNGRGEFVFEIYPGDAAAESAEAHARGLIKDMGLRTGAPDIKRSDGVTSVSAVCTFEGAPVFNCPVRFEYEDGSLIRVSGRRAYAARDAAGESISGAADALLSFLAYVKGEGAPCGEITQVEAGYQFNVSAAGDGELSPGWRVDTDQGEFFVYSSGAVERVGAAY